MRLLKAGEAEKALREFERAIELDQGHVEAHLKFQDLMRERGNEQAMIARYRRMVAAELQNPNYRYLLGRLLKGEEGEKEIRKAIELDPNSFWGHYGLAAYYHDTSRDYLRSEAEYRAALRLNPESISARRELAHVLFRHFGKVDEALAELERAKALAKNPEDAVEIAELSKQISESRTFNLIAIFAYLIAVLICAAFFAWAIKTAFARKVLDRSHLCNMAVILYSTLWFCLMFISTARGNNFITGIINPGIPEYLILIWMAFWPAAVYHSDYILKSNKVKLHKFFEKMIFYFYLAGIALALVFSYAIFVVAAIRHRSPEPLIHLSIQVFLFNFALVGALSLIMTMKVNKARRSVSEDPRIKAHRRFEMLALLVFLFIFWPLSVSSIFHVLSPGKYLGLVSTLMPLPFIIGSLYYEARYAFIDIFIKKTAVIIVIVHTTISYYLIVTEKLSRSNFWKGTQYPALLAILPVVIAAPFLAKGVERLIDRYVFRRKAGPGEVLSNFSRAIRFASDERELAEAAKERLIEMLSTKNVMVFFSEEPGIAAWPIPGLKEELTGATAPLLRGDIVRAETADFCEEHSIEVIVPLLVGGETKGFIALGRRYYQEPYLSEDLNLVRSLADHLEFALENIRLERRRRQQELREQELKVLASRAELRALRAQINPHFLFNALNTIASLIRRNPRKAEETVEMLADIFRYTLARSAAEMIALAEELSFVNAYLEVEKARFGEKLEIEIKTDPRAGAVKVPSMLLQPLVENAVKHGILPKMEGGKIVISANCDNGLLRIEVADNGVGFDSSSARRLYREGIGLKNVRDRLRAIYGGDGCFEIHSRPGAGTKVVITIPILSDGAPWGSERS